MTISLIDEVRKPAQSFALPRLAHNVWPLADQMLISAANFFVMVLLARTLSMEAFGALIVAYAVLSLANSIQAGIITQPHNVLGAAMRGDAYSLYTTSTAVCQALLVLLLGLLSLLAAGTAYLLDWPAVWLMLAMVPALVTWQLQEFFRRVLYTEERLSSALMNDVICYVGQAAAMAVLWRLELLTAPAALICISGGSAIAAVFGCWQLRGSFSRRISSLALAENWQYGKWLLGGKVVGQWLSSHMLTFLAALALGTAAAGVLRTVHTIMGPTRMLAQVLSTVLPTRFARTLADQGPAALRTKFKSTFVWAVPLLGVYCVLVAIVAEPLMSLVFGKKYSGYGSVLALYSIAALVGYLTMIAAAALKARRLTRQIFTSELISVFVMPLGLLLIPVLGIYGVIVGLIAADVLLLYLLCVYWKRAGSDEECAVA